MRSIGYASALTALIASATAAFASDPTPPPLPQSWTGIYLGGNIGRNAQLDTGAFYSQSGGTGASRYNLADQGVAGGVQAGYNLRLGGVLLGLETDFTWTKSAGTSSQFPFGGATDQIRLDHNENWVGTLRPRVGVVVGSFLVYGTGGWAYGNVEHSFTETRVTVPGQTRSLSESATRSGYTYGGGVEMAVTNRVTLGVEYLRIDLGSTTLTNPASTAGGLSFPTSSATFTDRSDLVRLKLNYRF